MAVLVSTVLRADVATAPDGTGASAEPDGPRMARDHWHAAYVFIVCGVVQAPAPFWAGGVHTHDDGIVHIHPQTPEEEGYGARLVKWFEYGGGLLTEDAIRMPGSAMTFQNGDRCPGGAPGVLQIYVNEEPLEDWMDYIPQDGDGIAIIFGPEEADSTPPADAPIRSGPITYY